MKIFVMLNKDMMIWCDCWNKEKCREKTVEKGEETDRKKEKKIKQVLAVMASTRHVLLVTQTN